MVTCDDNIFEGKTYEECLMITCGNSISRYLKAYKKCMKILNKIPMGWKDD